MKQTKLFRFSLIAFCLLSLNTFATEQNLDREKKIIKNYSVSANDKLNIENEYGQVVVNTWDKNEVNVEITVMSSASTDSKAQDLLESVSISETKAGGAIYLKTLMRSNNFRSGKTSLKINYNITLPSWLNMNLVNKFGNVYLPSLTGNLQVKVTYGNVKAEKLMGNAEKRIEVSFGAADITEVENLNLESKYSKLTIDKINKGEIQNSFGKTIIQEVNNLRISQRYGDLDIRKVNTLVATVEFSNIDLDVIGKSADLNLKYSGNAELGTITSAVEMIKVNANFSTVYMKFDETANLDFDAHLKFGDLKLNNRFMKEYVKSAKDNTNNYDYKGKIGNGAGGNLLLTTSYTTVYLQ